MSSTKEFEHLQILLNKEPIIATWTAQDLLERPATVRENYLKHVRSFVILGRGARSTENDQPTVSEYEKRLIKLVKENGAAKGYITAEYGYGKTSTAAFIWHRCEQNEIIAVPPFQIQKLEHLLSATYGWVRFKLANSAPQLLEKAEQIYQDSVKRGIEAETKDEKEQVLLRRLHQEGRYTLDVQTLDYLRFFEGMTDLVREAGYSGLVVIADEVQQYIDPDIKSGRDPLTELFNLIQALLTRKGHLPFALLFSIPSKELGLMNDQRSDLVQRLKSDGLALDLGTVYNQAFAHDLWQQLAHDLEFESLKDRVVLPETLEALGQISARQDLANGPRTVVDVFRLMVERYQTQTKPFTPLDLVDAFLQNDIHYDNVSKLQSVILGHLNHQFVRDQPAYQQAIKLMGAFPIDGLPERYFDRYQLRDALDKLLAEAQGDIMTLLGGGFDENGQKRELRAFLLGLEAQKTSTNWLDVTIREFKRNYQEGSLHYQTLARKGFQTLLREHIFKGDNWKLTRSLDATFTQNRTLYYEGAFPNTTRKNYPNRTLQIRLLGEKEETRPFAIESDLILTFRLALNYHQPKEERRKFPGQISTHEKETIFLLNMSYNSGQENYGDLLSTLGTVVSPWETTPSLLLSLYAYLAEKQDANVVPKIDNEIIQTTFQPALLEHAFEQLFNTDLGAEVGGVGGIRIVEILVKRELEKHYPHYRTLITNTQWKQSIRKYHQALEHLPTPYERQGKHLFEGTKTKLASEIFVLTPPALENYLNANPLLIKQEGTNKWRFTLHPLEEQIIQHLKASHLTESPRSGGKVRHKLQREVIIKTAKDRGYRDEEIDEALHLLQRRELVSFTPNRAWIITEEVSVPQVSELRNVFALYQSRLKTLHEALRDDPAIAKLREEEPKYVQALINLEKKPDEQMQTNLEMRFRRLHSDLDVIIQGAKKQLFERIRKYLQQGVGKQLSNTVLEQALPEGAFHAQLQTQRLTLLKTYGELAEKREHVKGQLEELHQQVVEKETLTERDILSTSQKEQRVVSEHVQLERQIAAFLQTVDNYEKTRQVLRQANDLQQRLKHIGPDSVISYQKELDGWALLISGELSSQKIQGLKHHARWQEQLDGIKQRFDAQLQAERERFQRVQQEYREFLTQSTNNNWSEIAFNPSEPEDSYKQLWDQVYNQLAVAIKRVQNNLRTTYERAARLHGGALENLPETNRTKMQQGLDDIQRHLGTTIEQTANWVNALSKERVFEKIGIGSTVKTAREALGPVLKQIQGIDEWLETEIRSHVYSYEQQIIAARLSPQEEVILTTLKRLQQSAGMIEDIELGVLLQQPELQNITWQDIRSLYAKQHLSIKITPVAFR
ncbi:hypothetical protein KSC_001600 [Ktedonobacter sp. SOSP1-52]|uniref:hypothetical protein n=1 Tax=Ktedonobacter sp. SOSP1-52 TaxID=2778366 RepID=UPI0019158919|nr:hypothetical protein [Ktedonobacter sp. SOSP1-52]GHO61268.1 hypothetical protein KSC_001600 [Ktedonobacter sp. SOSP1-52]